MTFDPYEYAASHGVPISGEQVGPDYHAQVDHSEKLTLSEVKQRGGRVTRVRIVMDPGYEGGRADFSYVHATLRDGRIVPVDTSDAGYGMTRWNYRSKLIEWAKAEGVYGKAIGLLDAISTVG